MPENSTKTIRIKWVRSGIGFTRHQKTIVRSLGLNKLNHTVVRPDTPQIRGVVASVPHLLEIVPEPVAPAWGSIPEYTVHPMAPKPVEVTPEPAAAPAEAPAEAPGAESHQEAAQPAKAKAPKAKAVKAKATKKDEKEEKPAAKKAKSTKGSKK